MRIDEIRFGPYLLAQKISTAEQQSKFQDALMESIGEGVFSPEEKMYFKNLFPHVDTETHIRQNYNTNGPSTLYIGRLVDKKG